jgi:hypothetical protein
VIQQRIELNTDLTQNITDLGLNKASNELEDAIEYRENRMQIERKIMKLCLKISRKIYLQ